MRKKITLLVLLLVAGFTLAMAQTTVKGKVTDSSGQGLPGVTVKADATTSTATDALGNYSINVSAGGSLTFSFIGYTSKTESVTNRTTINISLAESQSNLNEIIVVGYGTQKKSVVTGAISGVKGADLENQPVTRIEQSLQGRTSGLTIAATSGQPGASSTVRLRGFTSFGNGKNEPLWVIDGVVIDNGGIGFLNQDDIESIEVLKDAASAAIYGTRAAAGVILITTKKGKAGTLRVNYSGFYGTQAPAKKLDLLNASQYATLRDQAFVLSPSYIAAATKPALPFADPASLGVGTDWQSLVFSNSAKKQQHEFSVSGGTDKASYFTSFGYTDIRGIVAPAISKFNRANIRINTSFKPAKWVTFGENLGYSHGVSSGVGETNREFGGILNSAINLDPVTPSVVTNPTGQAQFLPSTDAQKTAATKNPDGYYYGI